MTEFSELSEAERATYAEADELIISFSPFQTGLASPVLAALRLDAQRGDCRYFVEEGPDGEIHIEIHNPRA